MESILEQLIFVQEPFTGPEPPHLCSAAVFAPQSLMLLLFLFSLSLLGFQISDFSEMFLPTQDEKLILKKAFQEFNNSEKNKWNTSLIKYNYRHWKLWFILIVILKSQNVFLEIFSNRCF